MYQPPPTKSDVVDALNALKDIKIPEGDNEGEPINSASVYPTLAPADQDLVDHAERLAMEYLRSSHDEPNKRAITELGKAGIQASLHQSQYDPNRLVGRVQVGDIELDVSDPSQESDED